jgi:protein SCO1/2
MRRFLPMLLAVSLLAGCSGEDWETRYIGGLMPPLEFQLTGADGEPLTEAAFRGDVTMMFFGYTFCPDVCPATLAKLSAAIEQLPEDTARNVQVLFVSVDPKRDDPERIAAYAGAFGERVSGATGTQEQLRELTRRYRTTFGYGETDQYGNYLVSHASAIFVFDEEGEVRLMFRPDDSITAMADDLAALAG